jgi:hypothetical protein
MTAESFDPVRLIEQYGEASKRAVTEADEPSRDNWRRIATRLYNPGRNATGTTVFTSLLLGSPHL